MTEELDSGEPSGSVTDGPTEPGEGRVLSYPGSGGVYRPTLRLAASTADQQNGTLLECRDGG